MKERVDPDALLKIRKQKLAKMIYSARHTAKLAEGTDMEEMTKAFLNDWTSLYERWYGKIPEEERNERT